LKQQPQQADQQDADTADDATDRQHAALSHDCALRRRSLRPPLPAPRRLHDASRSRPLDYQRSL
jgi:hypothetical protein